MVIGHFAVGFALKRFTPRASLGVLMAAAVLPDLLSPIFMLAGWERFRIVPGITAFMPYDLERIPYSHSLLMTLVWALLFAGGYWLLTRFQLGAAVIFIGVLSHWLLDFITHRPDLPLYPGGSLRVGLGLWHSILGTLAVEVPLFIVGVWLYITTTHPKGIVGVLALWGLIAAMVLVYASGLLGAPPADERAATWFTLSVWLVPLWAWWIDREHELNL
ncbi:MAG TPA: hypothetical protein PKA34_08820 [Blastocatellia bacterium]|nr:hypothetical protein [Blastocatellia bacterium]